MDKWKIILISGASAIAIACAALWFLVLQPDQQKNRVQAEQLLVSGINLFNEKKYDQAIETLQRIPPSSAHESKALYYLGSAHMMLKNFESAVKHLDQALALDAKDSSILYALGVTYYKLGHIKLAKGYFASVLEINPDDQQAKGLMDIMARLERRSTAKQESEQTSAHPMSSIEDNDNTDDNTEKSGDN